MCCGVGKSGWPIPRLMIERPCAASALARASTSNAVSVPRTLMRPAVCSIVYSLPIVGRCSGSAAASRSTILLLSPMMVQNFLQPLRRDREPGDRAGDADGVVDRRGDCRPNPVDPGLAGSFEAEGIEGARRVLGQKYFERRKLAGGRQQIVGECDGKRFASFVVKEFL